MISKGCGISLYLPRPSEPGWALGPSMIHTTLAEIEGLVTAAGLDLDALSLIISEALDEDLGGRGVLPAGTGAGLDVTSYATIPATSTARTASSSYANLAPSLACP